jgi:hypothetical protein
LPLDTTVQVKLGRVLLQPAGNPDDRLVVSCKSVTWRASSVVNVTKSDGVTSSTIAATGPAGDGVPTTLSFVVAA